MKSKLSAAFAAFSIIGFASSLLMYDANANPVTIHAPIHPIFLQLTAFEKEHDRALQTY